jgi:hypothetical protein
MVVPFHLAFGLQIPVLTSRHGPFVGRLIGKEHNIPHGKAIDLGGMLNHKDTAETLESLFVLVPFAFPFCIFFPVSPRRLPMKQRYEMRFAPNFSCIIGGAVYSTPMGASVEDEREKSIFGEQLVYVNVGLVEQLKANAHAEIGVNNNDDDVEEVLQRRLVGFWGTLRRELVELVLQERVTVRTLAMLAHMWTNMALRRDISYPS